MLNTIIFPGDTNGNESACNAGDTRNAGSGSSPGGGNSNPLQYYCLKISWTEETGGYSPGGHKELDVTL